MNLAYQRAGSVKDRQRPAFSLILHLKGNTVGGKNKEIGEPNFSIAASTMEIALETPAQNPRGLARYTVLFIRFVNLYVRIFTED